MATDPNLLQLHLGKPSPARIYAYLLEPETTNAYAIDRTFADEALANMPDLRKCARENRRFSARAVELAIERGIRQFIDIGSGLPSVGQPHDVAERLAPGEATAVYVDNEPIAHAHADVLLSAQADAHRHKAVLADFFDIVGLWRAVKDTGVIDDAQPVCLLATALLHFMPPEAEPEKAMRKLLNSAAPGSMVVISHGAEDPNDAEINSLADQYGKRATSSNYWRSDTEIKKFFGDWELLEPGLTWAGLWRPPTDRTTEPWWREDNRPRSPWWGEHPELIRLRAGVAVKP